MRLGLDEIDLLQLHEPSPDTPIAETMSAVEELIDAGKVRFAGVSNFSVTQLEAAQQALIKYPIVSNQVRYSLVDRTIEQGLLPYCQAKGITVIAYCPLARGMNRIRDCDPRSVIDELARSTGKSPAQIVLNWCVCQEGVVAIPKGNSEAHIVDICGASGWRLTTEQKAMLDSQIKYRRRSRFDTLVRRITPESVRSFALSTLSLMPPGLRRRFL